MEIFLYLFLRDGITRIRPPLTPTSGYAPGEEGCEAVLRAERCLSRLMIEGPSLQQ